MSQHVLVVEDEEKIALLHRDYLASAGFSVTCFEQGNGVIDWVRENRPDLIVLDLLLPGMDGHDICKGIRAFSNVPIIMVTAKVDEVDRLIGLELGADDYICKPFSAREVVARVRAVLRRREPTFFEKAQALIQFNEDNLTANIDGRSLELTLVEFQLLTTLVNNPGRIYSRAALTQCIYSDHRVVSERTIDSHIKKIRKKLHQLSDRCEFIHSVYGAGYKFECPELVSA